MASRGYRLTEFNQEKPPLGRALQILCEDHIAVMAMGITVQLSHHHWSL